MKKIILVLSLLIFFASSAFGNESKDIQALSLQECLTVALTNHPSLKKSQGAIKAAEASINQTKASNKIKVNATARTGLNGDYQFWDDRSYSGSLSLTISKILYDTNVNKLNIEIGNENLFGIQESERQTRLNVAANAKKAYYDLVLKILARDVEKEKLKNLEQHLITARGIYDVGNSSYIDVTKAESDFASAQVSLLKAENDILLSQEALKIAMGINTDEDFDLALSTGLLLPKKSGEIKDLLKIAIKDRPDYKKIQHTLNADELSIKVAARSNSPTITGSVGSDLSKSDGNKTGRDYSAAVSVNIPVEDGGLTAAKVAQARAVLEQDQADEESLRHTINQEVKNAAFSLSNAIERAKSSEKSVQYSEENLGLAQGRYEVGVGDPLEVSDAVNALATARYSLYQAIYDAQTARTDLDLAIGHFPYELEINSELGMRNSELKKIIKN